MTGRTIWLLAGLGLLLCIWPFASGVDPIGWLDPWINGLPGPAQLAVSLVVLPLLLLQGFSFMAGSAMLAILLWRAERRSFADRVAALAPLSVPVLSSVWLAAQALVFLTLPRGTAIRPMGWALMVGLSSLALMIFSVQNTVSHYRKGRNKISCGVALVLSLLVVALPSIALNAVVQARGLVLD